MIARHVQPAFSIRSRYLVRHAFAADGVDQHVGADARDAALRERVRHVARDVALLVDEVGEGDRLLRAADWPFSIAGKISSPLSRHLRAIASHELRVGLGLEGAKEGGSPTGRRGL